MSDEEKTQAAYIAYFNKFLQNADVKSAAGTPLRISNLIDDLADGVILIELFSAMFKCKLPRCTKKPRMDIHKLENLSIALDIGEKNKIKSTASSDDFLNKNEKVVIGYLWQLILRTSEGTEFRNPWQWAGDLLKKQQEEEERQRQEALAKKQSELDDRKKVAQERILSRQKEEEEARVKAEEEARRVREEAQRRREEAAKNAGGAIAVFLSDKDDEVAEHVAAKLKEMGAKNVIFISPVPPTKSLPNCHVCNPNDAAALQKLLKSKNVTKIAVSSPEHSSAIVAASKNANIDVVVKVGVIGSDKRKNDFQKKHDDSERDLKESGLPCTFVRCAPLMSTLAKLTTGGEMMLPTLGGIPWLDPSDAGTAVANALLDESLKGKVFNITGPAKLTAEDAISAVASFAEDDGSAKKKIARKGRKGTAGDAADGDSGAGDETMGGRRKDMTEETEADLLAALNKRMRMMKAKASSPAEMQETLVKQGFTQQQAEQIVQSLCDFPEDSLNDIGSLMQAPPKSIEQFSKEHPEALAKPNKVFALGADGEDGKGLAMVQELRKNAIPVRCGVKNAASPQALALAALGCEVMEVDATKLASVGKAMTGCDKAVIIQDSRPTLAQESKIVCTVAKKLPEMCHVIVTSVPGAEQRENPIETWHDESEKVLDECVKPVTFVRCAPTYTELVNGICPDLRESSPGHDPSREPNGKVPFIHPKDIGKFLARVVGEPGTAHINETYTLTGPKPITLQEAVNDIAKVAHITPSKIESCTPEQFAEALSEQGVPNEIAQAQAKRYTTLGTTSHTKEVSNDFKKVTGDEPTPIEEFAQENPDKFTPPETVVVFGADDPRGVETIQALVAQVPKGSAPKVRACVSSTETPEAKLLASLPGVTLVQLEKITKETVPQAVAGASKAILIQDDTPEMPEEARIVADECKKANVGKVTRVGLAGSDEGNTTLSKWHNDAEHEIEKSGVAHTFIRATPLMTTALDCILLEESTLPGDDTAKPSGRPINPKERPMVGDETRPPGGNPKLVKPTRATARAAALPMGETGAVQFISPKDVGKAVAQASQRADSEGKTFTVAGPELITGQDIARYFSTATGVPVHYKDALGLVESTLSGDDTQKPSGNPRFNHMPPNKKKIAAKVLMEQIASASQGKPVENQFDILAGRDPQSFRTFATAEAPKTAVLQCVPTVLVSNAETPLGEAIVRQLRAQGVPVVEGSANLERLKEQMLENNVESVVITEPDSPELAKRVKAIADAAKSANVTHAISVGVMDSQERRHAIACWHDDAEKELKESGLAATHVRCAPTFEDLLGASAISLKNKDHPTLQTPCKASVAWVDTEDIAKAVAGVVLKESPMPSDETRKPSGNPGKSPTDLNESSMPGDDTRKPSGNPSAPKPGKPNVHNVTGAESLYPAQVAKLLSTTERPIEVLETSEIPPTGFKPETEEVRKAKAARLADLVNDASCFPTQDVQRLTSSAPTTLREHVQTHRDIAAPEKPLVLNCDEPTGVGYETVKSLAKSGPVIAGVSSLRSPEAQKLREISPNVELRLIETDKPEFPEQLKDVSVIYNVLEENPNKKKARAIGQAAHTAGVKKIVTIADDAPVGSPVHETLQEVLTSLEEGGVQVTNICCAPTLPKVIQDSIIPLQEGKLMLPKFKKMAFCDPRDIAEAACKAGQNPHSNNKTYHIAGASLTGQQIAEVLGHALEKPITFQEVPTVDVPRFLSSAGCEDPETKALQYQGWEQLTENPPENDLPKLTGKSARALNREDLARAVAELTDLNEGTMVSDDTRRPTGRGYKPKGPALEESSLPGDDTRKPSGTPSTPPKKVCVIGADDLVGLSAVRELSDQTPVVAMVMDPNSPISQQLKGIKNVTVVAFRPDEATISQAIQDCPTVIWNPIDSPDMVDIAKKIKKACDTHGVEHVIKVGTVDSVDPTHPIAIWHNDAEKILEELQESSLPSDDTRRPSGNPSKPPKKLTNIRTSCPMNVVAELSGSLTETQGQLQLPLGTSKQSFIDPRDIGSALACSVLDPTTKGENYHITGKQALTGDQIAAQLSRALGKPVVYNDIDETVTEDRLQEGGVPLELFESTLDGDDTRGPDGRPIRPTEHPIPTDSTKRPSGNPFTPAQAMVKRFVCPRDDTSSASAMPTKDFKKLVGREPSSFEQFTKDLPEVFEEVSEPRVAVLSQVYPNAEAKHTLAVPEPKIDPFADVPVDNAKSVKRTFIPAVEVEISKSPDGNLIDGEWDPWHSGGNHDFSTWRTNPQFKIKVDQPMKVEIILTQKKDPPEEYIGWHIVENTDPAYLCDVSPAHRVVVQTRDVARKGQSHMLQKSVQGIAELLPDHTYFLVPSCFYQKKVAPFKFDITKVGHDYKESDQDGIRLWRVKEPRQYAYTLDIRGDWMGTNCPGGKTSALWRLNPTFKFTVGADCAKRTPAHVTVIISRAEQKVTSTEGQENADEDYKIDLVDDRKSGYAMGVNLAKNRSVFFNEFVTANYEILGENEEYTHRQSAEVATHHTIPVEEFADTFFIIPSTAEPGITLPYCCTVHSDTPITVSRVGPEEGEGVCAGGNGALNVPPGWHTVEAEGEWTDTNAGGRFITSKPDSYRKNPQFRLETSNESNVPVSVMFFQQAQRGGKYNSVALHAVRNADPEQVSSVRANFKVVNRSMFSSEHVYGEVPETSVEVNISKKSPVIIVPSTFLPDTKGKFKLVVLAKDNSVKIVPLDTSADRAAEQQQQASSKQYEGSWLVGQTSGGNSTLSSYRNNPTYLCKNSSSTKQTVKFTLTRTNGEASIGLAVLKNTTKSCAHKTFFNNIIALPDAEEIAVYEKVQDGKKFKYHKGDTCVVRADIVPNGTVFVIPSTNKAGETGHFTIQMTPEGDASAVTFAPVSQKPVHHAKERLPKDTKGGGENILFNPAYQLKVSKTSKLCCIFRKDDQIDYAYGLKLVQNGAANEKDARPAKGYKLQEQISDVVDGEETEFISENEGYFTTEVQPGTYFLCPSMIPIEEGDVTDYGEWQVFIYSDAGNILVSKV